MSATLTAIPAATYRDDGVHSSAGFTVRHALSTFRGSFPQFAAELTVGEDGAARLAGSVPVSGLKAKDENLEAHLQSPDFFDAEQHSEISFESAHIAVEGDQITVTGDLTIKGHTERVVARGTIAGPVEDPFGNEKLGMHLETVVDRTRFGLNWNAPMPGGGFLLADDVTLIVDLELIKG
jgi:polyisoprenoid-binding protein YceI